MPRPAWCGDVADGGIDRTYQQKTAEATHDWFIIDAAGRAPRNAGGTGRARCPAARTWTPHIDAGDFVVVINAEKIELGGDKWNQKVYHRHSGFPGGLNTETASQVRAKYPERLIERAVRGMLATNRMRNVQLGRLSVYAGDSHPHAAQKPATLP